MKNHIITIKNPACYDLDPYIGKYCEYTSIDEPDKPFTYAGLLHIKYIRKRTRRGLSGLLGRSPDPSESPRTFAAIAANW